MDTKKAGRALVLGGVCWIFGIVAVTLGELEFRGEITDNPIPDWLSFAVLAAGSVMFVLGLRSFNQVHGAELSRAGWTGYWIAFSGLAISIVAIWPFVVVGPFVAGVGLTIYGSQRARTLGAASAGAWMHALCFPVGVVVGILAELLGYDGGIGVLAFLGCMILGLAAMGLKMTNGVDRPQPTPTTAVAH
jgi:hypothetical protein